MNSISVLRPLSYSEAQRASKVSCFEISKIYNNYQIKPLYNDDGSFIEFDGENVFGLYKDGEAVKTQMLFRNALYGDVNFVSAVDILVEYEGLPFDLALKEVFFSVYPIRTDAIAISADVFKLFSAATLKRIKPIRCSMVEWNNSSLERKVYLVGLYSSNQELTFLKNRFGLIVSKPKTTPMKFAEPTSKKTCHHITNFLVNDMHFDSSFVKWLIDKHLIYEDVKNNLVCPSFDDNKHIRWAYVRSSWNRREGDEDAPYPLSQVVPASVEELSWRFINPMSRSVYVFDDMLELLSYMQLMKLFNDFCPDMAMPIVELSSFLFIGHCAENDPIPLALSSFLKENSRVKKIIICFSNDKESIASANYLKNKLDFDRKYKAEVLSSNDYSSFNDYLKKIQEMIRTGAIIHPDRKQKH